MNRALLLAGLCAAILTGGAAAAQETSVGALTIRSPWSRATPGGAKVGAGYLEIENRGPVPDRLVGVSTEIAGRGEIHESVTDGSVTRMRPVAGVEIPPAGRAALSPGGRHLMFAELKRALKEGDRFVATLQFEKAGPARVEFVVRGLGAAPGGHHRH
jgi:copper(I)-binding protein